MKLILSGFSVLFIVARTFATVTGQDPLREALSKVANFFWKPSIIGLFRRHVVEPIISSIAYATRTRRQATTPTFTQPVRYMIPSGSASVLTCINSDSVLAVQRASFQFPSPINLVQFQGNNLLGPQAMTVGGSLSTAFTAAPQSTAYPVAATFDFNTIIPSSFQPSIVRNAIFTPGIPPVLNITTEDSVGHDRNDLTCLITNAVPPFKPASECTTGGGLQCCQMVVPASSPTATQLLGLLGIAADPDTQVGITCSPVTVTGTGSLPTCSTSQVVCCTTNVLNGVAALGCSPVDVTS